MIQEIKNGINAYAACSEGIVDLNKVKNEDDIFELYFKYIDFALKYDYPAKEVLKKISSFRAGIIVDRKYVFNGNEKLVLLGKCDIEASYEKFQVARLYVKDESILIINARDNAYVVVDAFDNTQVFCQVSDSARVVVNRFKGARVSGATKIIEKKTDSYEL